ncbi:MAG: DUF86 domain-containing protein [Cyclobacteriaceae bacterium]
MKDPRVLLSHILECLNHIEQYTEGLSKEQFLKNFMVIDAVIRNIEVIGEASRGLSNEFRELNNTVPWRAIISMRNMVIHEYFNVDTETVWYVVKTDLPKLKGKYTSC